MKIKCNFILKIIIILSVLLFSINVIPSNNIIIKEKILIISISLFSFYIINNYIK